MGSPGTPASYRAAAYVLMAAAAAWVGLAWLGQSMAMGVALVTFLGGWVLMMAAMMLPAIAPVSSLYVRTLGPSRAQRVVPFVLGYLLVWSALGLPAFLLARAVASLDMAGSGFLRWGLVGILLALAAYQLTPLKRACLSRCRSPLSLFLRYASFSGRLRDLKVGGHHALYCAGCCWPFMVLLVAVGTMNLVAMVALTAVITAEKLLPRGQMVGRAAAAAAVGLAVVLVLAPASVGAITAL